MVSREIYHKRLRRLCAGIYMGAFSALGWVLCAMVSPNPHIWWIATPIIIFIVIIGSIAIQAWVFEGE